MSIINASPLLGAGADGYRIERSLRFNSADSAYLSKTPTTPTNNLKWTFSCWVKRSALGASSALLDAYYNGTNFSTFYFTSTNELQFYNILAGVDTGVTTTGVYRDLSAWYHIVFVFDSANATAADRAIIYVNGTRPAQTNPYGAVTPSEATYLNNPYPHSIGRMVDSGTYLNGYLTETYLIDGQALTPSSFGETDTITGVWKPKRYSGGTYGTNGFYLKFADNSGTTSTTLGKDSSGNGNNWTPNNFSVTAGAGNDSLIDTPTPYADGGNGRGNYCTWNPVEAGNGSITFANGNLQLTHANAVSQVARGTFAVSSGKWYWEVEATTAAGCGIGVIDQANAGNALSTGVFLYGYASGNSYNNGSFTTYGATFTDGDIIGVALDKTANTLTFYKNGVSQGTFTSSLTTSPYQPAFSRTTGTPVCNANFGQRAFAYTPPSGFLALNTNSLPEPSIKKPSSYMDVLTWSGTGGGSGATRSLTGLGFSPDLVWGKIRTSSSPGHILMDAVRGVGTGKYLQSNTSNAEGTSGPNEALYGYLSSLDSAGFTVTNGTSTFDNWNKSGDTYVAWCWDESATPGFDIVTYTGTGVARTVSHSLGVAPKMMIVKNRTTAGTSWAVYTEMTGAGNYLRLNSTIASTAGSTFWNSTAPTSSVFSVGTDSDVNANTNEHVAYLWSEVAGFSKFGSYTGNGVADGPFVFCNFRPRWVLIKSSTVATSWYLFDAARGTVNVNSTVLYPNVSAIEDTNFGQGLDFTSNGFKVRAPTGYGLNNSGATYIFMAFAESPAKYALAR